VIRIHDVKSFVAVLEALFDEGKENTVFLVLVVEEGTNVP
jgi:hypothetical protein